MITLSKREIDKYHTIQKTLDGLITISEAADSLSLSTRQIKRLKKGVKEQGPQFLAHKLRGVSNHKAIPDVVKSQIITLKQTEYSDTNIYHFMEILSKYHNISYSYAPIYNLLRKNSIKSPKKHRRTKKHNRRKRRDKFGELVQMDASPFQWFNTDIYYDLHGIIDDATGQVLALYFTKNECLDGYYTVVREMIENFGIPENIYVDRHAIFRSPIADKITIEDQLQGKIINPTNFGLAMQELNSNIIYARTPQAKGRIERLWNTLQSRLPTEFKIASISNMEKANEFLKTYILEYNKQFAKVPEDLVPAFKILDSNILLDNVLCKREFRKLDNGSTFSFKRDCYQLIKDNVSVAMKTKTQVMLLLLKNGEVKIKVNDEIYDTRIVEKARKTLKEKLPPKSRAHPVRDDHYYTNEWNIKKQAPLSMYDYESIDDEEKEIVKAIFSSQRAYF
jgi:transposase